MNHVTRLFDDRVSVIDDFAVADHLIETRLSKATTKRVRDQIGRRARDHLETARYLGLLYRKKDGAKFTHMPTEWGRELAKYKINQECPSDPMEEAILVDRICRFKLANASYHQEGGGLYASFRNRPCLTILSSLERSGGLNVFQIAYILADPSLDVCVSTTKLTRLADRISSPPHKDSYINSLTPEGKRNIKRDTSPFLDWCEQLGLLQKMEELNTVVITSRGTAALDFYRRSYPIWWADLGHWGELAAAAILLISYLKLRNKRRLIKRLMQLDSRSGLFVGTVGPVLSEATGLDVKQILSDDFRFDFGLAYDVPPAYWESVKQRLQELLPSVGITTADAASVIHEVEWKSVRSWQRRFRQEADFASQAVSRQLNVRATIPTASIQYHFQSDYEAATYVLLQPLQKLRFSVAKYQGQLVEYFADDPHWRQIAATNPDLLITNGFLSLIECKSIKEWGPKLVLNKSIAGELILYAQFAAALREKTEPHLRCRAVFSYEGEIGPENRHDIETFLSEACPGVTIILRSALQKALVDKPFKKALRGVLACAPNCPEPERQIIS